MNPTQILNLISNDIDEIVLAFQALGWNKPRSQYELYLKEQIGASRTTLVARREGIFAGYVTLLWQSKYSHFKAGNVPELSDLNVLPQFRNQGIGSELIFECERLARAKGFLKMGLGVGLVADYGNAQRLYCRLGYSPDGKGLHCHHRPVQYKERVVADDDLVLYQVKDLNLK